MIGLPVDATAFARAIVALAVVLAALVAALWLLRRHGGMTLRRLTPGTRLAVTASLALDPRIRLVLVRRDTVEHLLAIGPGGVIVVECLPAHGDPVQPTVATS
jgi:flagellar protein FliO/FliZ